MRRMAMVGVMLGGLALGLAQGPMGNSAGAASLLGEDIGDGRVMVILQDGGGAEGFIEYAENLLKRELQAQTFNIINPELMKKVKQDKLLLEAINNGNATALATISADYGAGILIRGSALLDANAKFGASYEASAVLNVRVINTRDAREIGVLVSDPMGNTANPMPIEDSALIAKQKAMQLAVLNIAEKLGFASKSGPSSSVTIAPAFHDLLADVQTRVMLFSADSRQLLYVSAGRIQRWDVAGRMAAGAPLSLPSSGGQAKAAAISRDGTMLALGGRNGTVTLLDAATGLERGRARSHSDDVNSLAFSPDGNLLASGGADARIYVYQARSGEELFRLRGPDKAVRSVAFSPDGRYLIAASEDKTIRVYDVNVQKEVRALKDPASHVLSAAISDDGTLIALATKHVKIDLRRNLRQDTELIKVRDLKTGEELLALEGHDKAVTDVAFFPGRRFLASAGMDQKINIWDLQQGTPIATLRTRGAVLAMQVSPDGRWLAGADESGRVQIWKTR